MLSGPSVLEDTYLRDACRLFKAQPVWDVHDEALRGHCLLCIATAIEQGHHLQAMHMLEVSILGSLSVCGAALVCI